MKHFIWAATLLLASYQQQIDLNALKKDTVLVQYKNVMKELSAGSVSKRYQLPNDANIMKEMAQNPTKEGMKKLLNAKGMANADEYVDKLFLQTTLMFTFLQKHPEISRLDPKKKQELIDKLLFD